MFMLVLVLVASGSAFAIKKEVAEIYKAAEKEGEIVWSASIADREATPIVKAFNKEHPKIKATYVRQHGSQAMERLMREIQVGQVSYDVIQVHSDYYTEFLKMDVIEKVNWTDFGINPKFVHPDKRFVNAFDTPFVFVYNNQLVKPEEAPKTWEDFLNPKWKGKFIVDTRPSCYIRLTGAWGPEKVLDYLRKLGKNKPIFFRGQTKAATLMAAGDYMMSSGMYLQSYVRVMKKSKGMAPLGYNVPDPVPSAWYFYGILKKGIKHPNAGKVFLGWLGSKGFKLMEELNWAQSAPFEGSRKAELYKGKTISYPPTPEQVPDRAKYNREMLSALGVRKSKSKKK